MITISVPDSVATKYDRNAAQKKRGQKYLGMKKALLGIRFPSSIDVRIHRTEGRHSTKTKIKIETKPHISEKSPNDWYKEYLDIQSTFEDPPVRWKYDKFPTTTPKDQEIRKLLSDPKVLSEENFSKVNFSLLYKMLRAKACGFSFEKNQKTKGESIVADRRKICQIVAREY